MTLAREWLSTARFEGGQLDASKVTAAAALVHAVVRSSPNPQMRMWRLDALGITPADIDELMRRGDRLLPEANRWLDRISRLVNDQDVLAAAAVAAPDKLVPPQAAAREPLDGKQDRKEGPAARSAIAPEQAQRYMPGRNAFSPSIDQVAKWIRRTDFRDPESGQPLLRFEEGDPGHLFIPSKGKKPHLHIGPGFIEWRTRDGAGRTLFEGGQPKVDTILDVFDACHDSGVQLLLHYLLGDQAHLLGAHVDRMSA